MGKPTTWRDLIKHIATACGKKPVFDAVQDAILQLLQNQIKPEGGTWGGVDESWKNVRGAGALQRPSGESGDPGDTSRTVAGAPQDANK